MEYTVKLEQGGNSPTDAEKAQLKKMFEELVRNFNAICGGATLKTTSVEEK